jgi:hypothetical protein
VLETVGSFLWMPKPFYLAAVEPRGVRPVRNQTLMEACLHAPEARHRNGHLLAESLFQPVCADGSPQVSAFRLPKNPSRCLTGAYLIIVVVQAPPEQDHDPRLQVVDHGAKLGECAHGTRSHRGVLQDDPVVDVADVLAGVRSLGPFVAQEV